MSRPRSSLLLLSVTLCALAGATAGEATSESERAWDISSTVRGSAGYKRNVAASAVNEFDRPFWRAEADAFVSRALGPTANVHGFVSGDVLRYLNPRAGIDGEQQWLGVADARWQPWSILRLGLKGVGFIEETFIDPSQSEGQLQPVTFVRLHGGYATFTPRLELPGGFVFEPSFQAKAIRYRLGYTGDYDEARPGARLEWKRSERLTLSAAWYEHHRHYRSLHPYTRGGRIDTRQLLALTQRAGELKASTRFQAAGTWTLTATAGTLRNRDHASGFLDYDQRRGRFEIEWARDAWRISLAGESRHLEYRLQTVGFGLDLTPRITEAHDVTGRVERELSARWTVFAETQWERNRSNLTQDPQFRLSYETSAVLGGVQRTF